MNEDFYRGKTALITGSGRGIGRAIALHFASLGSNIVVSYFRNRGFVCSWAIDITNGSSLTQLIYLLFDFITRESIGVGNNSRNHNLSQAL